MDFYQEYIAKSRYARFDDKLGRRENWNETVKRYFDFMESHLENNNDYTLTPELRSELETAVLNLEVMPSMRALMSAGVALARENVSGYNCSYLPIDHPRAFDELLYILMCGTGVGFSVERQYVSQLPAVNEHFEKTNTVIVVEDHKAGWARSVRELISLLYAGQIPSWDISKLRPAGARLKTSGGRSSGPGPLIEVFKFIVGVFKNAAGRKLTSLECHDLICKIAECVVVGGVRRSALISLSNLSDDRMRNAKSGEWWKIDPQRSLANNSAVYTEKPEAGSFMKEWLSIFESKSGERGIFNRESANKQAEKNGRRKLDGYKEHWGTNPCGEILLRPYGFCNLSEVVIRAEDMMPDLARKVRLAAILGTFQSTLVNFKYLRKIWRKNAEEERLLGVSFTGIADNEMMSGKRTLPALRDVLIALKQVAIDTNAEFAGSLGINPSAAITCTKPSGTVSQLVNSSSGIHARYALYYIRTVRGAKLDPIAQFMTDRGFPSEPDLMAPDKTLVFSFPIKSPSESMFRDDLTAVEQLELWKVYKNCWCEHNPSVTVFLRDHEWPEVGAWVYKNFDDITGVSFLPHSNHNYQQAPYSEITEEEYLAFKAKLPSQINWDELALYEQEDNTTGTQELNCSASTGCEII